jgi:hypothetical protein
MLNILQIGKNLSEGSLMTDPTYYLRVLGLITGMYILFQISDRAKYLLEIMQSGESPSHVVSELMNSDAALKITGRIHLFTLLFEVGKKMLTLWFWVVNASY